MDTCVTLSLSLSPLRTPQRRKTTVLYSTCCAVITLQQQAQHNAYTGTHLLNIINHNTNNTKANRRLLYSNKTSYCTVPPALLSQGTRAFNALEPSTPQTLPRSLGALCKHQTSNNHGGKREKLVRASPNMGARPEVFFFRSGVKLSMPIRRYLRYLGTWGG